MAEIKKISPISGFPLDVARVEPLPGVYDWDWLDSVFDAAARVGAGQMRRAELGGDHEVRHSQLGIANPAGGA